MADMDLLYPLGSERGRIRSTAIAGRKLGTGGYNDIRVREIIHGLPTAQGLSSQEKNGLGMTLRELDIKLKK